MHNYKFCKIENNPTITRLYTAFHQELEINFKFHGETHNFWELLCVIKGEIQVAADHRVFTLKEGQAILHNPMQFHNISCLSGSAEIIVFSFDGENIPPLQNRVCTIENNISAADILSLCEKYYNFETIIPTSVKNDGYAHLKFIKALESLIISLAEISVGVTRTLTKSTENYSLIIKTLNEHISERLTVAQIAKLCNMSEIGLQKTFAKFAGMGIMEYFNQIKMFRAQTLLKEGHTVKETALSLGFCDQNYFSTVFKRIMGKSPKELK